MKPRILIVEDEPDMARGLQFNLEARGYLYRRNGTDRYRLSLKLFELAHQTSSVRQLTDAALPVMQALAPLAMQSCHLAVLSGTEALIVLQIDSPLPMRYSVMLGAKGELEAIGITVDAVKSRHTSPWSSTVAREAAHRVNGSPRGIRT